MKAPPVTDYRKLAKARLLPISVRVHRRWLPCGGVLRYAATLSVLREFRVTTASPLIARPLMGRAILKAGRGEVQAGPVAEAVAVPFRLSLVLARALNEVARGVTYRFWFQLKHDPQPRLAARTARAFGGHGGQNTRRPSASRLHTHHRRHRCDPGPRPRVGTPDASLPSRNEP